MDYRIRSEMKIVYKDTCVIIRLNEIIICAPLIIIQGQ